jgi:hypothetical protein
MPLYSLDGTAPETPPEGQWWLAPDAHVIGRVRLAKDVGIWFGSVLRGDNEWIESRRGHEHPGRLRAPHGHGRAAQGSAPAAPSATAPSCMAAPSARTA